ncbi:type IV pilus modification PilV family protein [Acidithiobacillus sulfuriphilus]|uniref:type IV pilus modification PilV family protein n=1 Tax=Acidithiobacillus sulfuriphilus TaxID=1867749 RepID=UPI003F60A595
MNTAAPGAGGKTQGVTLIELVMAMVLLGFVAALIIPVLWYGRFGANPVPTAQATAIAQSTLEQGMVAPYSQPFGQSCGNPNTSTQGAFTISATCSPSAWTAAGASTISAQSAEYLTVQVTGPGGADVTLGAWRTKYSFGGNGSGGGGGGDGGGNGNQQNNQ